MRYRLGLVGERLSNGSEKIEVVSRRELAIEHCTSWASHHQFNIVRTNGLFFISSRRDDPGV